MRKILGLRTSFSRRRAPSTIIDSSYPPQYNSVLSPSPYIQDFSHSRCLSSCHRFTSSAAATPSLPVSRPRGERRDRYSPLACQGVRLCLPALQSRSHTSSSFSLSPSKNLLDLLHQRTHLSRLRAGEEEVSAIAHLRRRDVVVPNQEEEVGHQGPTKESTRAGSAPHRSIDDRYNNINNNNNYDDDDDDDTGLPAHVLLQWFYQSFQLCLSWSDAKPHKRGDIVFGAAERAELIRTLCLLFSDGGDTDTGTNHRSNGYLRDEERDLFVRALLECIISVEMKKKKEEEEEEKEKKEEEKGEKTNGGRAGEKERKEERMKRMNINSLTGHLCDLVLMEASGGIAFLVELRKHVLKMTMRERMETIENTDHTSSSSFPSSTKQREATEKDKEKEKEEGERAWRGGLALLELESVLKEQLGKYFGAAFLQLRDISWESASGIVSTSIYLVYFIFF